VNHPAAEQGCRKPGTIAPLAEHRIRPHIESIMTPFVAPQCLPLGDREVITA